MGAAAGPALFFASTALTAAAGYQAYTAQKAAARTTTALASRNAEAAGKAAAMRIEEGQAEESRHRLEVRALVGRQKNAIAGAGVELGGGGSPENALEDTALLGELDARMIRANAEREAWGLKTQATTILAEGRSQSYLQEMGAYSSLFKTASSLAGSTYDYGAAKGKF